MASKGAGGLLLNLAHKGIDLSVVRLVWTNALAPGYRPANQQFDNVGGFSFTAVISLESSGNGQTRYTALVMHGDPASRKKHADMGFHDGWGAAFDQLVALVKSL
jgi:uncharacterized protein YndB with AHSA1/START domain